MTIWATWCPPCVREVPILQAFADRAVGKVDVVGVLHEDLPTNALEFARQYGMRYPSVVDEDGRVLRAFGSGPPVTVLVKANGQVAAIKRGEFADVAQIVALVDGFAGGADVTVPAWLLPLAEALPTVRPEQVSRFLPPAVGGRAAAVLALFGEGTDGPDLLFIERASTMRSHAGQPAFPGGAVDDEDDGLVSTALREAQEEVGSTRRVSPSWARCPTSGSLPPGSSSPRSLVGGTPRTRSALSTPLRWPRWRGCRCLAG